tara:strand:- start:47 stop:424 length:378 start_codon:yes stop_codon:yes gene_type:complete
MSELGVEIMLNALAYPTDIDVDISEETRQGGEKLGMLMYGKYRDATRLQGTTEEEKQALVELFVAWWSKEIGTKLNDVKMNEFFQFVYDYEPIGSGLDLAAWKRAWVEVHDEREGEAECAKRNRS